MPARFPAPILAALDAAVEITIHTATTPPEGIAIWVVTVDGQAYVRSYRGRRGKWYAGALADPSVSVTLDGEPLGAHLSPVDAPSDIAAVSAALARKYAASSYLAAMLREDVLATTLLLSP
jgi:hypothetical protein